MYRVLLAEPLDAESEARLAARAEVLRPDQPGEDALRAAVVDCDAIVARTSTPITAQLIESGTRLRAIGVAGIGVDKVDVAAAAAHGVAVLNTPAASTDAVADFTLALLLQLLRPIPVLAGLYRRGRFHELRLGPHGPEMRELTVGIVGMGRIGSAVGRRCAAFGARVLYNDIRPVGPFDFPATPVDKPTLWRESGVVTLHVPLTEFTKNLLNPAVLADLRPGAFLINTARGAAVDTNALVESLESGHLGGAALDVVEPEPLPPDHPLFEVRHCILTPHIAARTHGGLRRMFGIVDDVLNWLDAHLAAH